MGKTCILPWVFLIGFGSNPNILQFVQTRAIDQQRCRDMITGDYNIPIADFHICFLADNENQGACSVSRKPS